MKKQFDESYVKDFENKSKEIEYRELSLKCRKQEMWQPFYDLVSEYGNTFKRWDWNLPIKMGNCAVKNIHSGGFGTFGFKIMMGMKTILNIQSGIFDSSVSFVKYSESYIEELKLIYEEAKIGLDRILERKSEKIDIKEAYETISFN